jgi:hypothetical protein
MSKPAWMIMVCSLTRLMDCSPSIRWWRFSSDNRKAGASLRASSRCVTTGWCSNLETRFRANDNTVRSVHNCTNSRPRHSVASYKRHHAKNRKRYRQENMCIFDKAKSVVSRNSRGWWPLVLGLQLQSRRSWPTKLARTLRSPRTELPGSPLSTWKHTILN